MKIRNSSLLFQAVHGHNKPITALALSTDKQWLYTADFEGHLTRWNVQNGESKRIQPQIHKAQVGYFVVILMNIIFSFSIYDNSYKFEGKQYNELLYSELFLSNPKF